MNVSEACSAFRENRADQYWDACSYIARHADELSVSQVKEIVVALASSGTVMSLPQEMRPYADVPSTGAPASLSTLLAPLLVASGGARVPKISATGSIAGGIDTLALVPGFKPKLDENEFIAALQKSGIAHVQQSSSFCPADKVLIDVRRQMQLMANPNLAAASLLSKKVAVPGTAAVFDVRVGATGNIGSDFDTARRNVKMFQSAAESLDLHVGLVLTDNRYFPSSALGRVESLKLLWEIVNDGGARLQVDRDHLETNIILAAEALRLAYPDSNDDFKNRLRERLATKAIRNILISHLEAQGASLGGLEGILNAAEGRERITVEIDSDGLWIPPDLELAKNWIKKLRSDYTGTAEPPENEVGLSLLVSPNEKVFFGQPVIEVRFPIDMQIECPPWLKGATSSTPLAFTRPEVLASSH